MANNRTFGRRAGPQRPPQTRRPQFAAAAQGTKAAPKEITAETSVPPLEAEEASSLDRELLEWKRARRGAGVPWRPLSLIASLCFGIASFVLPDSINDVVQWPLYALMAASFYVGISSRRRKSEPHELGVQPGTRGP